MNELISPIKRAEQFYALLGLQVRQYLFEPEHAYLYDVPGHKLSRNIFREADNPHGYTYSTGVEVAVLRPTEAGYALFTLNTAGLGCEGDDVCWCGIYEVQLPTFGEVEVGMCAGCDAPRLLYATSVQHDHTKFMCGRCWSSAFDSCGYRGYSSFLTYTSINDIDYEGLKPSYKAAYAVISQYVENLPRQRTRAICCDGEMPTELNEWENTSYASVTASTRENDLIIAHKMCTWACNECDERYVMWSPWNASATQVGMSPIRVEDLGEVCTKCHAKWLESVNEVYQCEGCSRYGDMENVRYFRSHALCSSCRRHEVYDCDDCGSEYFGDHDCDSDDDDALIHSYSYTPYSYNFHNTNPNQRNFMGFELEIEAEGDASRYDLARMFHDTIKQDHAYIKTDSSLDNGIEIVTHPHTLEAYREFDWSILTKLQENGARSWHTSTCGLHIHISRQAFGQVGKSNTRTAHQLRFMKLMYDNRRPISRLVGRNSEQYASWADAGHLVQKVKFGEQNNHRYSAINVENSATLEVRIFRGSLRKERVLSALELVDACTEYTRNLKVSGMNNAFRWINFIGFLSANVERYPNLSLVMSETFTADRLQEGSN